MAAVSPDEILGADNLRGRSLTGIAGLSREEILQILAHAHWLKVNRREHRARLRPMTGRTLALIFEKPSLRTRVTFEVAMTELGGASVYLAPADIQIGKRESAPDVAANLSRWVDGIVARTFAHKTVTDLADHAGVPVINALSDLEHPCQALADTQTIAERFCDPARPDFSGLSLAFIGDGNNVANSLFLACAKLGMNMTLACPPGYEPDGGVLKAAKEEGASSGARIEVVSDPSEAARNADVVYTDVWTSMGQEAETEQRLRAFAGFQVNAELMSKAKQRAIVLHCLPAHRGEEITSETLDGPQSAVLDQAENRLHAQKALLALTL